ncbi:uncharacterized protein ACR2FA_000180 [Aphomia sociella]
MDHNLEDTLNLESAISEMDFEHSEDTVVSQADITLNASSNAGDIPMEFENIEQQPMLMDTGNEEIIVTDFMGEQFTLQEYSIRDDQTSGATTTEESNIQNLLQSQSETMVDLQFEPQTVTPINVKQESHRQAMYISVKAAATTRPGAPRPVAIAPKPTKVITPVHKTDLGSGKQYAIAPKPVALVVNKTNVVKKVPLTGVVQSGAKTNTVLAQIGKQLVMMPAGSSQKIKLVSTSNSGLSTVQYAQFISKSSTQASKPVMAKVIAQGQSSNQPAMITKILPGSTLPPQARYVMQQKTIPISIGNNKVLLASPTKQGKKQQIIAIKSTPTSVQSQGPELAKNILQKLGTDESSLSKKARLYDTPINSMSLYLTDPVEVSSIICSLKNNSALGIDKITASILKAFHYFLADPIAYVINLSFEFGVFPELFKSAIVCPIFKGGDKMLPTNYRSISLLSSLSKVIERITNKRLVYYLERHNILGDNQYGFRAKRSTDDAVLQLTSKITSFLDKNEKCIGVFLDMQKAFDTVSIPILLTCLENIGVRGNALLWFRDYLMGRNQCVRVDNYYSNFNFSSYGVPQAPTTKKIVITANPPQNVVLKTTASKPAQIVNKDGTIVLHGQRSQLHKIDVPGKGIQLSRLVTNSTTTAPKSVSKQTIAVPKTFVLSNGNLIQMTAEKMLRGQPPPLVITGNTSTATKTAGLKPHQKLVRIASAPPGSKVSSVQPARSAQSLLAPLSTIDTSATLEEMNDIHLMPGVTASVEEVIEEAEEVEPEVHKDSEREEVVESKATLRALIADTVGHEANMQLQEVEVEYDRSQSPTQEESMNSLDQHDSSTRSDEHPLIVIPSNYRNTHDPLLVEDVSRTEEHRRLNHLLNVEEVNPYQSPRTPQGLSESDVVSTELGLRPRKACNCTKSQCLKLYCDCFANGEFCNRCNCNNCHNNLENEELRQKAIRACLDRNPNAFRPKIGKSKTGGPEIIRRHNKGCNCKRSGCLKNYCECYEAKIACTSMCKCVGCRNVEETLERARRRDAARRNATLSPRTSHPANFAHAASLYRPPPLASHKQPCSFMTSEVIEAVCQCLVAAAADPAASADPEDAEPDPLRDVIEEFARCLQDIISASHQTAPSDEGHA